jgi:hypothetical protein
MLHGAPRLSTFRSTLRHARDVALTPSPCAPSTRRLRRAGDRNVVVDAEHVVRVESEWKVSEISSCSSTRRVAWRRRLPRARRPSAARIRVRAGDALASVVPSLVEPGLANTALATTQQRMTSPETQNRRQPRPVQSKANDSSIRSRTRCRTQAMQRRAGLRIRPQTPGRARRRERRSTGAGERATRRRTTAFPPPPTLPPSSVLYHVGPNEPRQLVDDQTLAELDAGPPSAGINPETKKR